MLAPEMTLPAALRDAQHPDGAVRIAGLRNLAPALLAALDRPGPARCRDDEHPDVPAVRERLLAALADPVPDARGYAAMGLGTLGQLVVIDAVAPWLTLADDDADGTWLRETAVIALSYVGVALGDADAGARARVLSLLREAWNAPWPELRFQAALARIEVDDPLAEAELAAVLADGPRDDEPAHEGQLRAQIVFALGHVARLRPSTLDVLVRALERLPTHDLLATEIAIVLAAHERREGLASLRAALVRRFDRDRALEALAALGAPDPAAADAALRLLRPWVPPITRVRAAYAVCRITAPGSPAARRAARALALHAWHPRPAVREAVADARAALARLGGA